MSYYSSVWLDENYRKEVVQGVLEGNQFVFLTSDDYSTYTPSYGDLFYIGFPIKKYTSDTTYGVAFMGVKSSFFDDIKIGSSDLPELLQNVRNLLVDGEGTILFDNHGEYDRNQLDLFLQENEICSQDYIITTHNVERTDWKIYSISPRNIVFQDVIRTRNLEYLLIAVVCAVFLWSIFSVLRHQKRKIAEISRGILAYSDRIDAHTKIPLSDFTELNEIIVQFNKMTDRIYDLFQSLQKEKQATEKALNRQRKAELKTLEAQINPHFLYNTLDTINWMALEKNEYEISHMLGAMASLLRYSIANIDAPVLIASEIEWLKKYLFLQQKRFRGLFTYTIEVEPGLESCAIHKMLLQPLVENSILHAFCDWDTGGKIQISIRRGLPGKIDILVSDNGAGISPQKLEVLQKLTADQEYAGENIGFYNVLSRLNAYYGEESRLKIQSDASGTSVTIELPAVFHRSIFRK